MLMLPPPLQHYQIIFEGSLNQDLKQAIIMPIIPLLTDDEYNIEQMLIKAKECNVDYVLTGTLYLKGKTRVNRLRSKYCLSSSYMRVMREKLAETSKQKSLHF